jgi:hypothetical protein
MDMTDIPVVTTDEDWLELADGQRCLLRGRLYGPLRAGDESLIVSMLSWEVMAVAISGGYQGREAPGGAGISVVASRTEDGLETTSAEITIRKGK